MVSPMRTIKLTSLPRRRLGQAQEWEETQARTRQMESSKMTAHYPRGRSWG